jgi:hypothetical protein
MAGSVAERDEQWWSVAIGWYGGGDVADHHIVFPVRSKASPIC